MLEACAAGGLQNCLRGCGVRVGLVRLVIIALLSFGCGFFAYLPVSGYLDGRLFTSFRAYTGDNAKGPLEQALGKTFPASAGNFNYVNLNDQAAWLGFTIAVSDFGTFMAGSPFITCPLLMRDNFRPNFQHPRLLNAEQQLTLSAWWRPAAATAYIGQECTGSDFRIIRVLGDISAGGVMAVYIESVRL